ncbi:MAG: CBS domain-containing protein [Bacteroidales bacterium]
MIAKNLLSNTIAPLMPDETFIKALSLMDEYKISHLPVVNGTEYIGLLAEENIYIENRFEDTIGQHMQSLVKHYVDEYCHIFDVLNMFSEEMLSLLPVLDNYHRYLGVITLDTLMQHFPVITSINNPGAIIVLERSQNDYSLSEIAQIIESNDAKILSMFITSVPDSTMLEISIKINRMEIGPVLQTFDRYNYFIKATYGESSYYDDLKDRYDNLMTYLDI